MTLSDNSATQWHLDKRVPVALILALIVQLGVGVFMFGQMFERLENLEARVIENEVDIAATTLRNDDLSSRLTRIETILERIDKRLDRSER